MLHQAQTGSARPMRVLRLYSINYLGVSLETNYLSVRHPHVADPCRLRRRWRRRHDEQHDGAGTGYQQLYRDDRHADRHARHVERYRLRQRWWQRFVR